MAQHILLSRQAESLTFAQVFQLSDAEAEVMCKAELVDISGFACRNTSEGANVVALPKGK